MAAMLDAIKNSTFYMITYFISQREIVLFLPTNMAAMQILCTPSTIEFSNLHGHDSKSRYLARVLFIVVLFRPIPLLLCSAS